MRPESLNIAVIYAGDRPDVLYPGVRTREWEPYLNNARCIAEALEKSGHRVFQFQDGREVIQKLTEHEISFAWICSGGIQGRDSAAHLPSILEMLGIEYIGSSPLAAALADNKFFTKLIAGQLQINVPKGNLVSHLSAIEKKDFQFPLIVKPVSGLCSIGIRKVSSVEELRMHASFLLETYDSPVLVEEYIEGRDVTVPILRTSSGWKALPPIERDTAWIETPESPVPEGFNIRLHSKSLMVEGNRRQANLAPEAIKYLCEQTVRLVNALDLKNFARIDYRVTDDGKAYLLEINHKPDLTPYGIFGFAAERAGIGYNDLIQEILACALGDS